MSILSMKFLPLMYVWLLNEGDVKSLCVSIKKLQETLCIKYQLRLSKLDKKVVKGSLGIC